MPGRILKLLSSKIFKTAISLILLLIIARFFGLADIASNIGNANKEYFLIAVLMFIASGILGALQWGILLRFHGIKMGVFTTTSRYFMGLFFNFVLPGFVGGDVMRIYHTSKISGQTTQAFSSTLSDRAIGFVMLVFFSLCAYIYLPSEPAGEVFPIAASIFIVFLLSFFVVAYRPAGKIIKKIMGKFTPDSMLEKIKLLYDEMHLLTKSPSTLFAIAGTSLLIQFARIMVHYYCGKAIGIQAGFVYFALFVPLMEVIASIPISLGGVGVRETIGATLFMTIGVKSSDVVSYTLLATFAGFIGSLPGGAVFVFCGTGKKSNDSCELNNKPEK